MTRYRESVRSLLHERVLDAAYKLVAADGWGNLRITRIATTAGVSRQTVYTEFGAKDAIGKALVMREVERFLFGIQEELDAHQDDFEHAVGAAVAFTLRQASDNPLLKSILTSARRAEDDLLAHLTTRSEPLLTTANAMLRDYARRTWPQLDEEALDIGIEALVRVTVSHIVLPLASPEQTGRRIARLAARMATRPNG